MEKSDHDLIKEVLAGKAQAFDALVQRYQNRLFGLIYHFVGNREDAEDLLQETWVLAYRKLQQFEGMSSFYTWLSRVAVNHTISQRRKKRLDQVLDRVPLENDSSSCGTPGVEERLETSERNALIRWAINQLDMERRTVILLRDFDGLDYHQIAEVIQVPVGTVRSRLHRARLELHELLKDKIADMA